MSTPVIELLFDYASPWSYLADWRVDRELSDLPVQIRRTPIYLRGLEAFKDGLPYSPAKLAYLGRDLHRCAKRHGVPFGKWKVPVNGLYMLRGHVFLEGRAEQDAYRREVWRATWVDGANVDDPEVVVDVAAAAGVDRNEFATGIAQPTIKQRLRSNTDIAIERQVFGVPTLFVGDEMFWGQDRIGQLRRHVEELVCSVDAVTDPDDDA
jgi:2-hydroxychromene-2-carboxylate isomerase